MKSFWIKGRVWKLSKCDWSISENTIPTSSVIIVCWQCIPLKARFNFSQGEVEQKSVSDASWTTMNKSIRAGCVIGQSLLYNLKPNFNMEIGRGTSTFTCFYLKNEQITFLLLAFFFETFAGLILWLQEGGLYECCCNQVYCFFEKILDNFEKNGPIARKKNTTFFGRKRYCSSGSFLFKDATGPNGVFSVAKSQGFDWIFCRTFLN